MSIRSFRPATAMFVLCVLAIQSLQAEVKLHRLFSDNTVLQRDSKVPVWGNSDKSDSVTVTFGDQTISATPTDGKWMAELTPMEASATPRDLVVKQGDQTVTCKNVLVGDVWLCGGQSNMEWSVAKSTGKDEAISAATNPNIRLFTVNRKRESARAANRVGCGRVGRGCSIDCARFFRGRIFFWSRAREIAEGADGPN